MRAHSLTFEHHTWAERVKYLQDNGNYPKFSPNPLTEDNLKDLVPGTPCYIISNAGLSLAMFVGLSFPANGDSVFIVYTHLGATKYKAKNIGKTYNLYRAILP